MMACGYWGVVTYNSPVVYYADIGENRYIRILSGDEENELKLKGFTE